MIPFMEALSKNHLISMGPVGTNLHRQGLIKLEDNASVWCFKHRSQFQQALQEWKDIGCDILFANTCEANPLILEKTKASIQSGDICQGLAHYAKEIAKDRCYTAGDLQPVSLSIGQFLVPYGELEHNRVYESYKVQTAALYSGGVDFIWIFTMACLKEIELAVRAIRDSSPLPIVATMAFARTRFKGYRTLMGIDPVEAARFAKNLHLDGFGVNCGGLNLKETTELLGNIRKTFDGAVVAMPNAGTPEFVKGNTVYPETPEKMAEYALKWKELGANIISGCCGTTPAHVKQMILKISKPTNPTPPAVS